MICIFSNKRVRKIFINCIEQIKKKYFNLFLNNKNDKVQNIIFHLYYNIIIFIDFFIVFITAYEIFPIDRNLAILFILSEIFMDFLGQFTNKYLSIMFVLSYFCYSTLFMMILESFVINKINMIFVVILSNAKFILFSKSDIKIFQCLIEYVLFTIESILFVVHKNKCDICYYYFETFLFAIRFNFTYSSFSLYVIGCILLVICNYLCFCEIKFQKSQYFGFIFVAICSLLTVLLYFLPIEMKNYCIYMTFIFFVEIIAFVFKSLLMMEISYKCFIVTFILQIIIFVLSINNICITIVFAFIGLLFLMYNDFDLLFNLFALAKIIFLVFDCFN